MGATLQLWYTSFSLGWLLLLLNTGSRVPGFQWLWYVDSMLQFKGSRTQAQELWRKGLLPCSMWDLPRPRTKPMSPAMAGRFLTTGPKSKMIKIK